MFITGLQISLNGYITTLFNHTFDDIGTEMMIKYGTTIKNIKGELKRKMNLWSNKTSVPSQSFSEICFHDNRM